MSSLSFSPSKERKCQCGVPFARLTSWTRENPGRKFRSCKFYDPVTESRGCKSFEWIDQPDGTSWQTEVINNLLLDKKLMKGEHADLKREVDDFCGQRRCLLNEIDSLKLKCKALSSDRKKMTQEVEGRKTSSMNLFVVFVVICFVGLVLGMEQLIVKLL
ncbi:uncharacterized protein LOC110704855 [Chenopodium quinoa]|uniref:uncharacterized protein LOC110681726 n=1 Tax=Chenopodium quinoa TaxID=63459 RepID=UPI000B799258|nr:uncharacterized protein LOC110681726 [Chenopodium quinoa]XP_021738362.1 uncharacterized protein LOC110704855 [Chenopodium quinoa]